MTTTALLRFWTLTLATYTLLEEEQARLTQHSQRPVTIGEARRALQRLHDRHLLDWIEREVHTGVDAATLYTRLIRLSQIIIRPSLPMVQDL
jgi:hypothetical protein